MGKTIEWGNTFPVNAFARFLAELGAEKARDDKAASPAAKVIEERLNK